MEELLQKFYNIYDISNIDDYFMFQNEKYKLVPFLRSEEEFFDLLLINEELLKKRIPTHIFMKNNQNSYLTFFQNKKYVLLKINVNHTEELNVIDMVNLSKKLVVGSKKSILYRNNWAELWSAKIDYFEYQIRQLGKEKTIILNSFSYYVGLAENAIAYVNDTTKNYKLSIEEHITLQRKRTTFPNLAINYFNPLYYVIDIEVRDIASYFKSLFFNSYEDLFTEVHAFFKVRKLSIFGYQLLYARLLFPSFYFDVYEKIMEGELEEKDLLPIINKASDYENFLKDMYLIISKYAPIKRVEWITNKKEL